MDSCKNCGWVTAPELLWSGLCLTCSEYTRRTGRPRPPPENLEQVHRGETWPGATDPHFRALVALPRFAR
jgi:hypothetical protein